MCEEDFEASFDSKVNMELKNTSVMNVGFAVNVKNISPKKDNDYGHIISKPK